MLSTVRFFVFACSKCPEPAYRAYQSEVHAYEPTGNTNGEGKHALDQYSPFHNILKPAPFPLQGCVPPRCDAPGVLEARHLRVCLLTRYATSSPRGHTYHSFPKGRPALSEQRRDGSESYMD